MINYFFKFINLTLEIKIETSYSFIIKRNQRMSFKVYNASAGSGKTYTLTKEYLKILFQAPTQDKYRRILAITFTNKAVEEMKSRIVDNLIAFFTGRSK